MSFSSVALQLLHDKTVWWCIGEYCPHKNMRPPQRVLDHSAAAQVLNLKAQVTVPVICLKQCVVGVRTKELGRNKNIYHIYHIHLQKTAVILNTTKVMQFSLLKYNSLNPIYQKE